jgi:hypothetical protein
MRGRPISSTAVLLALSMLPGCASWCARNYPCPAPAAYAPAACCSPAPAVVVPTCQPTTGYAPNWQTPAAAPCACPR